MQLFQRNCAGCGLPGEPLCDRCLEAAKTPHPSRGFEQLDSYNYLGAYEFELKACVLSAKSGNRAVLRKFATLAGEQIAQSVSETLVVSWVPASSRGKKQRGFDQSRYLAEQIAKKANLPVRQFLRRMAGEAQNGKDRIHRLHGPQLKVVRAPPPEILLVDDVATTGASLNAAAESLRRAGANRVHGLTIACVL